MDHNNNQSIVMRTSWDSYTNKDVSKRSRSWTATFKNDKKKLDPLCPHIFENWSHTSSRLFDGPCAKVVFAGHCPLYLLRFLYSVGALDSSSGSCARAQNDG